MKAEKDEEKKKSKMSKADKLKFEKEKKQKQLNDLNRRGKGKVYFRNKFYSSTNNFLHTRYFSTSYALSYSKLRKTKREESMNHIKFFFPNIIRKRHLERKKQEKDWKQMILKLKRKRKLRGLERNKSRWDLIWINFLMLLELW